MSKNMFEISEVKRPTNTIYQKLKKFKSHGYQEVTSRIKSKLEFKNKIKAALKANKGRYEYFSKIKIYNIKIESENMTCRKEIKKIRSERILEKIKERTMNVRYYNRIKDRIEKAKTNNFIHRMKRTLEDRAEINNSISSFFLKNEKNHPKLSSLLFDLKDTYIFPEQYIRFFEISKDFYTMKLNINEKYEKEAIEYSHEGWFRGAFLILKDITKTMSEETKEKLENKNNDAFIELNQNEITKDVIDYCEDNNLDISAIYRKCIIVIYDRDYYELMTY